MPERTTVVGEKGEAVSSMRAEAANVHSIRDFFAETLEEAERLDRVLHGLRDSLRARLHAIDLAEDDSFRKAVLATAERYDRGENRSISLEELRSNLLPE